MAGATGHPQQNDTLTGLHALPRSCRCAAHLQQIRQTQASQAGHTRLEHTATVQHRESFTLATIEISKGVILMHEF